MAKALKLGGVDPKSADPSKPKILIYGKPGVGKTWASLDFPSVFYIDTEGGADLSHYTDKLKKASGRYFGVEQGAGDFDNVLEQMKALATLDHPYKTVVIDSISKVFNNEIAKEIERLAAANIKNEYGADRKPAIKYMRQLVSWLQRIDMNVILIAHEKDEYTLVGNEKKVTGSTFDCWDKLEYELHLCLQITKQGESRKARVRKSRLIGFPDTSMFDWSYLEFANRYGKDVIEKDSKKLSLATEEQIAEIERLLGIVKLSDSPKDKWIAESSNNLGEIDKEKMETVINYLKGKVA